jgi:hypothetical protein
MVFGQKTSRNTQDVFGHKLTDLSSTYGHKHRHVKSKQHQMPEKREHDFHQTKVNNHESSGFDMRHGQRSNRNNSVHYSSDLERHRAPKKEKDDDDSNFL